MLSPEQIIERAKKWEIVFDLYDNQRPINVIVERKVKEGYIVKLKDLDLTGYLKTKKKLEIDQEVEAVIITANYLTKKIELKPTNSKINEKKIFKILKKSKKNNIPIKAKILNVMNGGFEISVFGQRGFIPPSHIPKKISENLFSHIGKEYPVYILRVNKENILASLRQIE
jgi:ribosomal protein S1